VLGAIAVRTRGGPHRRRKVGEIYGISRRNRVWIGGAGLGGACRSSQDCPVLATLRHYAARSERRCPGDESDDLEQPTRELQFLNEVKPWLSGFSLTAFGVYRGSYAGWSGHGSTIGRLGASSNGIGTFMINSNGVNQNHARFNRVLPN
jgi:hypothetical protein